MMIGIKDPQTEAKIDNLFGDDEFEDANIGIQGGSKDSEKHNESKGALRVIE